MKFIANCFRWPPFHSKEHNAKSGNICEQVKSLFLERTRHYIFFLIIESSGFSSCVFCSFKAFGAKLFRKIIKTCGHVRLCNNTCMNQTTILLWTMSKTTFQCYLIFCRSNSSTISLIFHIFHSNVHFQNIYFIRLN